jgi:hypothetical protein
MQDVAKVGARRLGQGHYEVLRHIGARCPSAFPHFKKHVLPLKLPLEPRRVRACYILTSFVNSEPHCRWLYLRLDLLKRLKSVPPATMLSIVEAYSLSSTAVTAFQAQTPYQAEAL